MIWIVFIFAHKIMRFSYTYALLIRLKIQYFSVGLKMYPSGISRKKNLTHKESFSLTQHVSCDLIWHSGPDVYLGGRHSSQARDTNSLPLPPSVLGAIKYPSTWARDPSPLPQYYSGGAEGSGGGGGCGSGKHSPLPAGGSASLSYQLNPTTLAMLQQHNYIPYFRGIRARRGWEQVKYRTRTTCWDHCCCECELYQ